MIQKRIFLVLFLLLVAVPAHAGVALGLKAGLSTTKFAADIADTKFDTGGVAGVSLAVDLAPGFAFAPELLYVRKGAGLTDTDVTLGGTTFGTVSTSYKLDYLELPLLLRWSAIGAGPVQVFATGGPTASLKLNEKFSISGIASYDIGADQAEDLDYGLAAGGGVKLGSMATRLTLEARWEWGLANISKLPFGGDVKNTGALVMAGLEFPF